ncbi:MAG: sulfite exporter TauE/SafE family protein [Actinobacteria bacterium]|nr:MAG: sulfite exporter TauE/SafE family protein [Actinomycetota bacterium]
MQLDLTLAGLVGGFVVGLTGMGGGALMTPMLVLLFHIDPLAAVSSDLVVSLVMKPVGASVHMRRGTVRKELLRWLMLGSVPAAFCGVLVLRALGDDAGNRLKLWLGIALLVAAACIVVKARLQQRSRAEQRVLVAAGGPLEAPAPPALNVRPLPTLAIGAVGGLVVGMTSVGSGSLIIVALMLLYPRLTSAELVGTDLVQAIPLVGSAALGHLLFGEFQLDVTAALLLGGIPGIWLGAHVSSQAPDRIVKPVLFLVLMATGLKLIGAI